MNPSGEQIEKVLDLIYDAAAESDLWRNMLTAIADLTNSQGGILFGQSFSAQRIYFDFNGRLDEFLISYMVEPAMRSTVMASSFASVLEMVREGVIEVHQNQPFAPIFLRKRADEAGAQQPAQG